ncbi:phage holin family protein [Myxococcota bacterium]|nr:phage holin family protein [Myxococcota bacterium]
MSTPEGGPPPPVEPGPEPAPSPDESGRVLLQPYLKILRRAVRSLRAFFAAHVIVVRTEAERELARLATAVALLVGAAMFFLASVLLLATTLVALVQRLSGLPWLESIAISLGATLLLGLVLLGLGWWRIKRPLMPESRELLRKTLDGLTRG